MSVSVKGVFGKNIKSNNVIIDATQHYILVPIVPGTRAEFNPRFEFEGEVKAAKLSDIDADGHIKYDFSGEVWTVALREWGNSILGQYGCYADAEAGIFDGKYYIYPTTDGFEGWGGYYFKAFSSPDLVNWTDEGVILDLKKDVKWSDGNAWAPCIIKKNGKYYYYFSANTDRFEKNVGKAIGVAVCDTPAGHFSDALGKPIVYNTMKVTDEYGEEKEMSFPGQVIDPAVFTDPESGRSYLYWGNGSMWVCELGEDMITLKGEPINITPPNFREGTHVFCRKGVYYFTWAEDDTRSKNYHVRWGYSPSPMGPIIGNEVMLEKNESIGVYGTGHHTVINVPDTDRWYICYHRFKFPARFEGDVSDYYGTHRELCMDEFSFDASGRIEKAKATLEGVTEGEEFCSHSRIVCSTPLDGIGEGDEIAAVIEVQSGECETELDCIAELYDYQSNLVATVSEKAEVSPFCSKRITLKLTAPERMRGHYLLFFTDDGDVLRRIGY